jgi:GNAT superfamily N-acetyltransferase
VVQLCRDNDQEPLTTARPAQQEIADRYGCLTMEVSLIEELSQVTVRAAAGPNDQQWLQRLWQGEWGGETMIVDGKSYHLHDLDAFIAWLNHEPVGAATTIIHSNHTCELMSLNAVVKGRGVGTILLEYVEQLASHNGCTAVKTITTNDNLQALKFYQKRGYRLAAFHRGAVDKARKEKSEIPLVGNHGIPLHDELELAKGLL